MSTSTDTEHKSTVVDSYCGAFSRHRKVSPLATSSPSPDVVDTQPQQYCERGLHGEMLVANNDRCEKREPTDVNVGQSVVYATTTTGFFDCQNAIRFPGNNCHRSSAIVTDTLADTISRMKTFLNGHNSVVATASSPSSSATTRRSGNIGKRLLPAASEINPTDNYTTNAESNKMTYADNNGSLTLPPNSACEFSVASTTPASSSLLHGTSVSFPAASSLGGTTEVGYTVSVLKPPSSIANPQLSMTSSSNVLVGLVNVISTDEEPVPICHQLPAKRQFSVVDKRAASPPIFVENQLDCSAVELKQTSQTVSIGSLIVERVDGSAFSTGRRTSSDQPVTSCSQLPQQQTFSDGLAPTGNSGSVGRAAVKFLLRRQMAIVSDVIGQLVAEVNAVASFLGQTRPPQLDARERAMMESMQSISTALKTLTPVCAAYRQLGDEFLNTSEGGGSDCGSTPVWNDARRLPSAKCLSRHEKMLKGCRDRMSVVFSERRRLVMQTPIADKQRQMTHDWLLRHRQTIIDSIAIVDDVMKAVLEPPAEESQLTQQQSSTQPTDSVANASPPTLSVLPSAVPATSTSISSTEAFSSSGSHAVMQEALHPESLHSLSACSNCQPLVNRKSRKTASKEDKVFYRVLGKILKKLDRKVKGENHVRQLSTKSPDRESQGSSSSPIFEQAADAISSVLSTTVETKPRSSACDTADIKPRAVNGEKNNRLSVFASRPETIIFDADVHNSTTAVKADASRSRTEALPRLKAACRQRIVSPVNNEPPTLLPIQADVIPTKTKHRKKKNRRDAEIRIKRMIISVLPQLLKSAEIDVKEVHSSTNTNDTISATSSPNSITSCGTTRDKTTVSDQTTAVSDPASSYVTKEGGKNNMTLGNEQLKTMLEERDQRTFSRLLVDSVCSLTPSDFERVWQTLIQKLMENRLRAKSSAGGIEDDSTRCSDGHCAHLPLIDSTVTHSVVSLTESCDVTTGLQSPCSAPPSSCIKTEDVRSSFAELDDVFDRFPSDSPKSVSFNADVITEQTRRRPKRTEFAELITIQDSDEKDDESITTVEPTNVITIAPLGLSDDECDSDRQPSCSNYNDTAAGGSMLTDFCLQNINGMCERTQMKTSKDGTLSPQMMVNINVFSSIDRERSAKCGAVLDGLVAQQVGGHDRCSDLSLLPHQLIPSATDRGKIVDDSFCNNSIAPSTAPPCTPDMAILHGDDSRQFRSFSSAESDEPVQQNCQHNGQLCSTPLSSLELSCSHLGDVVTGVSDSHADDGSTTTDGTEMPRHKRAHSASSQLFMDLSPRSPDQQNDVTCLNAQPLPPRYRSSPPSLGGFRQIDGRTLDNEHDGSCSLEQQGWGMQSRRPLSPRRLSPDFRSCVNCTTVRTAFGEKENSGDSAKLASKFVVEQSRSVATTIPQYLVEEDEKRFCAPRAILAGGQHVTHQTPPSSPVLRHQRKRKWPQSPVVSLPSTPTASPRANDSYDDVILRIATKLQRQCDDLEQQLSDSTAAAEAGAAAAITTPLAPRNAADTMAIELSDALASGTAATAASMSSCILEDIIKSTEAEIQQIRLKMEKSFHERKFKTRSDGIEQQRNASLKVSSRSTQDSVGSDRIVSAACRDGGCPADADRPQTLFVVANRNGNKQRERVELANKTDESEKIDQTTSGKAAEVGVVLGYSTDSVAQFTPNRCDTDTKTKILVKSKHKRQRDHNGRETSTGAREKRQIENVNQSEVNSSSLLPYGSPFSTVSSENDTTSEESISQGRLMDARLQIAFNRSSVDWQPADAEATWSSSTSSEKIAFTRNSAGQHGSHDRKQSENRNSNSPSSARVHIERQDDEKIIAIKSHSERSLMESSTASIGHDARCGNRYRTFSYGENRQRCRSLQSPEFNLASYQQQQPRVNSRRIRRPRHRQSRSRSTSRSTSSSFVMSSARTDFRTRLKDSISPTRRKHSKSSHEDVFTPWEVAVSGRGFRTRMKDSISPTRRKHSKSSHEDVFTPWEVAVSGRGFRTRMKDSISPTRRKHSKSSHEDVFTPWEVDESDRGFSREKRLSSNNYKRNFSRKSDHRSSNDDRYDVDGMLPL